jgi:hypothetical protein
MRQDICRNPAGDCSPFFRISASGPMACLRQIACVFCSTNDERLNALTETAADRTAIAMARSFQTWFGVKCSPSCLLVRHDAPRACRRTDVLRAFRNVCAIAAVTNSTAYLLTGGQWLACCRAFFLFASHVPNSDGSIGNLGAPVGGLEDEVDKLRGQCAGQIDSPEGLSVHADPVFLRRLFQAWHRFHLARPRERSLLPLFRSLEIAFQASRYPSDGFSSINDVGTRIGLWVSAFEVLFHPGIGSVNKTHARGSATATPHVPLHVGASAAHVPDFLSSPGLRRAVSSQKRVHARQSGCGA